MLAFFPVLEIQWLGAIMKRILCVCFSPAVQKTVFLNKLNLGEVNRCEKYLLAAGGKAVNSARVLEQLQKGCPSLICPAGIKNAALFSSLLSDDKIDFSLVQIPGYTRECLTVISKDCKQTTELILQEPVSAEDFAVYRKEFLSLVQKEVCGCEAVLISGSVPECWSEEMPCLVAKIAKSEKKILLVDACNSVLKNILLNCEVDFVKINEKEFLDTFETCKKTSFSADFTEQEKLSLLKEYILHACKDFKTNIIVTRGKNSTIAVNDGKCFEIFPEKIENIVNTTACGDSFNAGFLHEYVNGSSFEKALQKGTWCASQNAQTQQPGSIKI